jgi:hypothetical protein
MELWRTLAVDRSNARPVQRGRYQPSVRIGELRALGGLDDVAGPHAPPGSVLVNVSKIGFDPELIAGSTSGFLYYLSPLLLPKL